MHLHMPNEWPVCALLASQGERTRHNTKQNTDCGCRMPGRHLDVQSWP
jgi:hypothetical protein